MLKDIREMDVKSSQCDHSVKGMEQRMCYNLYVVLDACGKMSLTHWQKPVSYR